MKIWRKILETALSTPSPHNVQPWRVRLIDDWNAELLIDSTRTLPKEDVTGSFIILAMGMFIESISILAAQNNFQLDFELLREPEWFAPAILENQTPTLFPFAKLILSPAEKKGENQYPPELFHKRRTSRLSLSPEFVPNAAAETLKNLAAEWNQKFELTTDAEQIERVLSFNTAALFEDLNSPDYHDEIVEWFRYSERESLEKLDGLDYRCMNSSRAALWSSARFPWLMKLPIAAGVFARIYRSQLGEIPTIGLLAGDFWQPADAIKTGRFLMRFWLETARLNLFIHPFGNLVTNSAAAKKVQNEFGIEEIWLIFKIGFSVEPPQSYRLPLERILVG